MNEDTYRDKLNNLQLEVEELRAKLAAYQSTMGQLSDTAQSTKEGDTISRQAAIDAVSEACFELRGVFGRCEDALNALPSAQPEPKWIPVTTRPMTDEERVYYEGYYGHLCENEAVMFDCPMPDDEQEIWVCSDCGNVWQDACVVDIGIGLEGNGDWLDIVAWMPYEKPQPYSEGKENR